MKGIILATTMTIVLFGAITAMFRLCGREGGLRRMMWLYILVNVGLVLVWFGTGQSLGFLPAFLLTRPTWIDLVVADFLFSAAYFGGILQLYNLADRGFSLRFLIDILETPGSAMTADLLVTRYSAGKGIGWMYEKRLDGLLDAGLVARRGTNFVLTKKGSDAAHIVTAVRRLLTFRP